MSEEEKPLSLSEVNNYIGELKDWSLEGNKIIKQYNFKNFKEALDFINKVGELSEKHKHHPEIFNSYNLIKLELTTHSANGLTMKDFEVAREIDGIK